MSKVIWVVVYYRCSSPQQELSVEQQRAEVKEYCRRKGYTILREYIDEGKSGSKNLHKRIAFHRMIADSAQRDFTVVVCYDAARFTRMDNIDGSEQKKTLRLNGVFLDTVKEGEFDWRTREGRWKDMAYCESNKAAALNLSRDSNRGRRAILALGYWPNGCVPYGYDKCYTDGVHSVQMGRYERFRKGRNWHLRLIINTVEAEIVEEIFHCFVNKVMSRREIARRLNERKVPPPKGQHGKDNGCWDTYNIRSILEEKAYIGTATIGRKHTRGSVHNQIEEQEQADCCPKIVDTPLWHAAQEIAAERRQSKSKPQSSRAGALSGFLYCAHCGYRLNKFAPEGKPLGYICVSAARRPDLGCRNWQVYEERLLPHLAAWLVEHIDRDLLERLRGSRSRET